MIRFLCRALLAITGLLTLSAHAGNPPLVLFSDFGTSERFVASMKGVAMSVDSNLQVFDLSHDIEPQNVWQASFVLNGTIEFWPKGTVFVSVVDPGVGTRRKSVVAQTGTGHFIVTPDNGTLTLIADTHGVVAIREIDESVNRRPGTQGLHTFHGRDVYSYTGARLAAGIIDYAGVGPELAPKPVMLDYQRPITRRNSVLGQLIHVEKPFGNLVTNIPSSLLLEKGLNADEQPQVTVKIRDDKRIVFNKTLPYVPSFGFVAQGNPLLYVDSLNTVGLAVTNGNFAKQYNVGAGDSWSISITASAKKRKAP